MESILRDYIQTYLSEEGVISPAQHGFLPARSVTTQLLECLDAWSEAIDSGHSVDIIYLDLSKAFDSVPHRRLLTKMKRMGISDQLLSWCEAFLTGRTQRVVLNGTHSPWSEVSSGVPQGSVLGPLLFVIYINDMPSVIQTCIKLFADDAKVYYPIKQDSDRLHLQQDLDSLETWAAASQLRYNAAKCQVLHIGARNPQHEYRIAGLEIPSYDVVKDLGVLIDTRLSFQAHAESKIATANKLLGMIRRTFSFMDTTLLSWLFKAMVRPHLEYCHTVTHPRTVAQTQAIEGVLRRASKLIQELRDLPYEARLRRLKLPTMFYRFRRGDMITLFKYTHHLLDVPLNNICIIPSQRISRGHQFKLEKPRCRTTLRQKTFPHRALEDWNNLPPEVVEAPSVQSFKNRLDDHWRDQQYVYL